MPLSAVSAVLCGRLNCLDSGHQQWYRNVPNQVPKCPDRVPKCLDAEVSRVRQVWTFRHWCRSVCRTLQYRYNVQLAMTCGLWLFVQRDRTRKRLVNNDEY